jgi:putative salt-induced outer membrane protein
MMKRMQWQIALFVFLVLATRAWAEEEAEEKRWGDQAELSYVETGGNTDVRTLSAKNLLKYKFTEKLEGSWELGVLYGESDGEKNAERYLTDLRFDYAFTERLYAYAIGGWLKDEFAGFDARYHVGPGMGYKFLTGPKHLLLGEAGVNYVREEYTDNTDEDYVEGRAFSKYEYAFTEKNKFSQSLEFLYDFEDSENYKVNSVTALISALNSYLSMKASYEVKYNNQPVPSTLNKTDTVLGIALVINF